MENCPLDKLDSEASEEEKIETCENCPLEECVLNGTEDIPISFDEVYVKCLECKDIATLWLMNGEVEEVIREIPTKGSIKRERIFEPAGRYYSEDGEIWHRPCCNGLCEVISIRKGERP